jgi:hypothetical protein
LLTIKNEKMRNQVLILIGVLFIFAVACEKYPYDAPSIDTFTIEPEGNIIVGETVTFTVEGTGSFVIYTGDYDAAKKTGSNYDSAMAGKNNHSGYIVNEDGELIHEYDIAGTYNIVLFATSVGDLGEKVEQVNEKRSITVIDAVAFH